MGHTQRKNNVKNNMQTDGVNMDGGKDTYFLIHIQFY